MSSPAPSSPAMSSPTRPRTFVKALAMAAALSVAAVLLPVSAAQAHPGHDPIGGSIKRSEVITRAQNWVNRNIQYSQGGTATDPDGHHSYRRDCSGFVSMVWHIRPTGMSAPWTGSLGQYSNVIAKRNLKRGDILLRAGSHVVLFHKWANTAHTTFWLYEQSNPSSDMNHRVASLSSYSGYTARRYKHIVNG